MLLLGHLAKVQGLKGEFLLKALMDAPERLQTMEGLVLVPPQISLDHASSAPHEARSVRLRTFRWHQDRPCIAFQEIPDRTAAEPCQGMALWAPESVSTLVAGETYRHDWVGCVIKVANEPVGEVLRLDPTPMGYDMVVMKDLRPGRRGMREVPYIKAWFSLDLPNRTIHLDPPPGLLDLDRN